MLGSSWKNSGVHIGQREKIPKQLATAIRPEQYHTIVLFNNRYWKNCFKRFGHGIQAWFHVFIMVIGLGPKIRPVCARAFPRVGPTIINYPLNFFLILGRVSDKSGAFPDFRTRSWIRRFYAGQTNGESHGRRIRPRLERKTLQSIFRSGNFVQNHAFAVA